MIYAILFLLMIPVPGGGFGAGPFQGAARQLPPASGFDETGLRRAPELAALFGPKRPQLGRYEAFTADAALPEVVGRLGGTGWKVEDLVPLEAFGNAGPYDKAALAELYGGRRVSVARGWIQTDGRYESVTAFSPYPDGSLTELHRGTLILRFIICCL